MGMEGSNNKHKDKEAEEKGCLFRLRLSAWKTLRASSRYIAYCGGWHVFRMNTSSASKYPERALFLLICATAVVGGW